jgi:MFS family permease
VPDHPATADDRSPSVQLPACEHVCVATYDSLFVRVRGRGGVGGGLFRDRAVGRLSDRFGRRKFLLLAPYAAIVLKSWVAFAPSLTSLTIERIVCDGLRTLAGSTMGQASLMDLLPGDQLAKGMATLYASMGMGIIISPVCHHAPVDVCSPHDALLIWASPTSCLV